MRLIIAEDDRATAHLMSSLTRSWGYDVAVAHDGAAALGAFGEDGEPHLAILDWMLPDIDGPEVCRRIRAIRRTSADYLILLTSRNTRADVVTGLEAGADEYLVKPVDPGELRARLNAGARIISLQQNLAGKIRELEGALASVRVLSGLLPICAYCKSIRDDSNYWHKVEEYVTEHSHVQFSHGICPKCLPEVVRQMSDKPKDAPV